MSRPDRTRRHRLAGLIALAFILGSVVSPNASAVPDQVSAPVQETPDVDQFGGYIASARANGLQLTYDSPGLLPISAPIFQLSVPEALSTLNSGPVGYGLASFAFPGPLVADIGAALAAGGTDPGIPPYPIRSEAFFPSGPQVTAQEDAGATMTAITEFADTKAFSTYPGVDLNPAAFIGSIGTDTRANIESTQLYARAATEVSEVSLLGGLIQIDSVRTVLVATSNGTKSATDGATTVAGIKVLGIPATVDADGIRFTEPSVPEGSAPTAPPTTSALSGITDGLGLEGIIDPDSVLAPLIAPLNEILVEVGAAGDDALGQLFEATGIEIKLLGATETIDGATASRDAGGLSITINYDGANTPVLTDLLSLVPTELLPADNLGPVPLSPQAIVNLLKKLQIVSVALAPANVSVAATPAFEFDIPDFVPPAVDIPPTPPSSFSASPSTPSGSSIASPQPASGQESAAAPSVPASSSRGFPFGQAIPAILLIAALLSSPFFAGASMKLADNTLAEEVLSCPEGLDRPRIQEPNP